MPVTNRVTASHLIWVRELKLPAVACPADEGLAGLVGQQLQEKLPQLDGATACGTDVRACLKEAFCLGSLLGEKALFVLMLAGVRNY